jgi:hypothetical protein
MKRYNILDLNENLIKSNLTWEECIEWIKGRAGFLLEEIN